MLHTAQRVSHWFHGLPLRVATKFALGFMPFALVGAIAIAALFAVREAHRLRRAEQEDLAAQGRALVEVLTDVANTEGDDRMRAAVDLADRAASGVRIELLSPGQAPQHAAEDVSFETEVFGTYSRHALVLSRPTEPFRELFFEALSVVLSITMAMGALATMFAYFLGDVLVGAPLRRIVAHARRIAGGDLRPRDDIGGSLEIGLLKRELNATCDALLAAKAKAEAETAARIDAVTRLRHAERLSTVGTLAAGLAHELGTPLNVVYLQSKVIERAASEKPLIAEGAQTIRAQAERMTALVKTVLGFARRKQPLLAEGNLALAGAEAVALLSPLAKTKGATLEIEATAAPCRFSSAEMQQVIVNLVVNALDASRESKAPVRIRVGTTTRPTATGAMGCFAFVSVEDSGVGIDEENKKRIFEPFFTTKDIGEGTGLGLSVVYGIVEDHGGIIDVDSTVGVGTKMTVYLPALGAVSTLTAA